MREGEEGTSTSELTRAGLGAVPAVPAAQSRGAGARARRDRAARRSSI